MEWRATVGIPHYEVSSEGMVRSTDRKVDCRDGRTRRFKGQLIRGTFDKRLGYHRVVLWVDGKAIGRTVHSLVAEAFLGPRPPGEEVRHKNGRHADCRAENLEYGTRSENQRDQVRHGTHFSASKGKCPRGHALSNPNLVPSKLSRGVRECLACGRARSYVRNHPDKSLEEVALENYRLIMEGKSWFKRRKCS